MNIPVMIRDLEASANNKPEGYLEEVMASGIREGDQLMIDQRVYNALAEKYSPEGLGDKVAKLFGPIAKAIDWATAPFWATNLANCGGCKDRKEWLNRLTKTGQ